MSYLGEGVWPNRFWTLALTMKRFVPSWKNHPSDVLAHLHGNYIIDAYGGGSVTYLNLTHYGLTAECYEKTAD